MDYIDIIRKKADWLLERGDECLEEYHKTSDTVFLNRKWYYHNIAFAYYDLLYIEFDAMTKEENDRIFEHIFS